MLILLASIYVHESIHWVQFHDNTIAKSNNIILFNEAICGKDTLGCLNITWKENLTRPEIDIIQSTSGTMETQAYIIQSLFIIVMAQISINRLLKNEEEEK